MPDLQPEIEDVVPHRKPALFISEIISYDERSAVTKSIVADHWPLVSPKGVNALILIELVAQTAAVNNGWTLLQQDGPQADIRGWIVGIKKAIFNVDIIPMGTAIVVESVNEFEYDNFREIYGIAKIDEMTAAEVTLQLIRANP